VRNLFQILSLDGGGIKGLFSAAILAHLEEDFKVNITNHFDLIVGTSTGGIIALGLGAGIRPIKLVEFYVSKGPKIFASSSLNRFKHWFRHWIKNKYNNIELKHALKECFGDKLLADSNKRLVITAYNIGEDDIYLFKTPHNERLIRDWKVPMWKVALATSAAPTYFPSFNDINNIRLIDGGVWGNNPIMVGITEAVSLLGVPLSNIRVLSLGTTDEIKGRPKALDHGGIWQWKKEAINVILRGQSIAAFTQAQHLLGKDKVIRINPKVPDGLFKLDKLSVKELLAKAAHESRKFSPYFKNFINHVSPEFKLLYPTNKGGPR